MSWTKLGELDILIAGSVLAQIMSALSLRGTGGVALAHRPFLGYLLEMD